MGPSPAGWGVQRGLQIQTLSASVSVRLSVRFDQVFIEIVVSIDPDDHPTAPVLVDLNRAWELAAFPEDTADLRGEILYLLRERGRIRHAERLSSLIVVELARLVSTARDERERRLAALPPPAAVRWGGLTLAAGSAERSGVLDVSADAIEIRLVYCCEDFWHCLTPSDDAAVHIRSSKGGVRRTTRVPISLDGMCSEGIIQDLETWGWSSELATSVAYAVALTAREDWLALKSERDKSDRAEWAALLPPHR